MYHHFLESEGGGLERSSKQGALATWAPISRWMGQKFAVLDHEENYAFVMGHFCDSVDSAAFPNSSGVKVTKNPRWLKVTYKTGAAAQSVIRALRKLERSCLPTALAAWRRRSAFPQAGLQP